jgi:hypothetical protein
MILRRITEHVKAQNWTAVALDFVIVVVGVFIGIQVANWNERQAEKRLGVYYAERLGEDVRGELEKNRTITDYYAAVLDSVRRADVLLAAPDADPKELVLEAYRATEVTYIAPVRATWDQIVSSGHLGLLPEDAAGSGLSAYYEFDVALDVYDYGLESEYRKTVRKIIPISVQAAIRDGCSDIRDDAQVITGFVRDCRLDVDDATLFETAEILKNNPAVRDSLRYQYSDVISANLNLSGNVVVLQRALEALTSEESE